MVTRSTIGTAPTSTRSSFGWTRRPGTSVGAQSGSTRLSPRTRRAGESGIFIGRHDLDGRGIASEAIRLRTDFAWRELRLHRVHNWIAHANRGSRRANEKVGYTQMGLFRRSFFRSGEWYDEWLGEAYPHTFPD